MKSYALESMDVARSSLQMEQMASFYGSNYELGRGLASLLNRYCIFVLEAHYPIHSFSNLLTFPIHFYQSVPPNNTAYSLPP